MEQLSIQVHRKNLLKKCIKWWHKQKIEIELIQLEKEQKALNFSKRFTKKHYFNRWKMFIYQIHEERNKEEIGKELREKIQNWLQEFREKQNFKFEFK